MNDLGLSSFISSGMIIQRDFPFPIWSSKKITVSFLEKIYESRQTNGKWQLTLDPIRAGGPHIMDISAESGSFSIRDIYSGDLWFCAGQSNMEMQMDRLRDDFSEEWKLNEYPIIRQFKVPQEWDFSAVRNEITDGKWLGASADTLHEFSAVGWFFAKKMYEKYQSVEAQTVPIGLVNTAWGGTPIESWMSKEALAGFPKILADGQQYANDTKREEITQRNQYAILEWETNLKNEDIGFALGWEKPEADISSWDEMTLPGDFATADANAQDSLKNFCGVIWLAKDFEVSEEFAKADAKVWLGTIVDADTVYLNGKEIGNTDYRYPPRKYTARGLLKPGKNRIVIRVTCNSGDGGITCGNFFLIFTDNESIELSGVWKYNTGVTANSLRPQEFFFHYQPMGNFNAMIAPLLKYPLKGVIWYQGESNESRPHEYADLFKKMILDWRAKNGNDKLHFLFVQLPIFGEPTDNRENDNWALIREAQASALSLPDTGMAAALEFGEWNDIHPINKKDVGERLFLAAEKLLFGIDNTSPGPMVRRWERQHEKLYIYFNNYGDGLVSKEILTKSTQRKTKEKNSAFSVSSASSALKNGIFVSIVTDEGQINLPTEIEEKDCISVDLSSVKNPKKVLYAWANNPKDRQLYNSEGLPVLPFRIKI